SLTVQANLSNHGEYDACRFEALDQAGRRVYWYGFRDASDRIVEVPRYVLRSEARERLGIEAQRIIDAMPSAEFVTATCKHAGIEVTVERAHPVGGPFV